MLIIITFSAQNVLGQNTGSAAGLDGPVYYEARDSIVADVRSQQVTLFGDAVVEYNDILLTADLIVIDMKNSEVIATFTTDSLGNPVGKPLFTAAGEESKCDYIKYNFETKKGYIKEVRAQQDEGYLHMTEAKVHPNEEIHLKNGKFTTCENDTPHYHFRLSKAVIVPDERIATGPLYMKIFKVPTPLAAPFAYLPNKDTKKDGVIFPSFANNTQYGFGLEDFGYYIPIGDHWETRFYGSIFTTGRWGARNETDYRKRYKYQGGFSVKFEQLRGRFYDTTVFNKWTLRWRHMQDQRAHPSIKFDTDINFVSDNTGKSGLNQSLDDYYSSQFNSAVNFSKSWKMGPLNGSMKLQSTLQQNSTSGTYAIKLPNYNLSVARFYLGDLVPNQVGKSALDQISVNYTMNAQNRLNAPDSLFNPLDLPAITDYALNGFQHIVAVQSNLQVFGGRFTFNPAANYNEVWNFQYTDYEWNDTAQTVDRIDRNGFKTGRTLSFSGNLMTNFFGYYRFKGMRKGRFKHVASPRVSFTYSPDIGNGVYEQSDSLGNESFYAPFATSAYTGGTSRESGVISFRLVNTLKFKQIDKRDTINQTAKTTNLIDGFDISTNYDFLKDSFNLDDINLSFRAARIMNVMSFQSSAIISPYSWNEQTGLDQSSYAWNTDQGFGRFTSANAAITANFTNRKGRKKQKEDAENTENDANATNIATNPNKVDMDIPWKINLSYKIDYRRYSTLSNAVYVDTFDLVQTAVVDGDLNLGSKWKFVYRASFDLLPDEPRDALSFYNLSLWRDLHCWEAILQFGQRGPWEDKNFNFLFRVNIKAAMFSDIKLEYDQIPTGIF